MGSKTDRLNAINQIFFITRAEESGHHILEDEVRMVRSTALEQHLTRKGLGVNDYNEIYMLACEVHASRGAKGPFGIDEILMGANALLEKRKQIQPSAPRVKHVRNGCKLCNGTTLKFVDSKIQYEEIEGKKVVVRCECYGK